MRYADFPRYHSPLGVKDNYPSIVSYIDYQTKEVVGKVFREGGEWFLATCYRDWIPLKVSTKYEGFLMLSKLHKIQKLGYST